MKAEKRNFRMDPKLLFDVIRKQAGTLSKAVFEGVMNAADAGAQECRITISPTTVTIADDGKGFRSRKEIESWFETFGTPHAETEGKIYGTFRMGRGQMFSFGKNLWRSGEFVMDVDIKNDGLEYELVSTDEHRQGCHIVIKLYETLLPSQVMEFQREIKKLCRYIEVTGTKVYVGSTRISLHPDEEKWDHVVDDGWVRLQSVGRGLEIYNLGGFVNSQSAYVLGTGGVVVSKTKLDVNFARNDIMSTCPVWRRLKSLVRSDADTRIRRKSVMTESERQRVTDQILAGELDAGDAAELKIITDVNGSNWSLLAMQRASKRFCRVITSAPDGDRLGDTMHQQRSAFVVGYATLERFGVSDVAGMLAALQSLGVWLREYRVTDFAKLTAGVDRKHVVLKDAQCTPTQLLWRDILTMVTTDIVDLLRFGDRQVAVAESNRKILLGKSESAVAWTDGASFICFDVSRLPSLVTYKAVLSLIPVVVHELCHDGASTGGHAHSPEFYQQFHDCMPTAMTAADNARSGVVDLLKRAGRKPNKWVMRGMDLDVVSAMASVDAAAALSAPLRKSKRKPAAATASGNKQRKKDTNV